jgi:hypothetical protein
MPYRLLGHERVALTRQELERMVQQGLLALDTKVIRDGEGFATAIGSRPEFRHLLTRPRKPEPPVDR